VIQSCVVVPRTRLLCARSERASRPNIIISAGWLPDESGELAAAESAWARRVLQALQPHRAGSVYVNFIDHDDGPKRVQEAYPEQTYRRLAEVNAKYDPDNVFHHNTNIQPG
jgi:FAD/FMN-containing dehydrogenase